MKFNELMTNLYQSNTEDLPLKTYIHADGSRIPIVDVKLDDGYIVIISDYVVFKQLTLENVISKLNDLGDKDDAEVYGVGCEGQNGDVVFDNTNDGNVYFNI